MVVLLTLLVASVSSAAPGGGDFSMGQGTAGRGTGSGHANARGGRSTGPGAGHAVSAASHGGFGFRSGRGSGPGNGPLAPEPASVLFALECHPERAEDCELEPLLTFNPIQPAPEGSAPGERPSDDARWFLDGFYRPGSHFQALGQASAVLEVTGRDARPCASLDARAHATRELTDAHFATNDLSLMRSVRRLRNVADAEAEELEPLLLPYLASSSQLSAQNKALVPEHRSRWVRGPLGEEGGEETFVGLASTETVTDAEHDVTHVMLLAHRTARGLVEEHHLVRVVPGGSGGRGALSLVGALDIDDDGGAELVLRVGDAHGGHHFEILKQAPAWEVWMNVPGPHCAPRER